MILNIKTKPRIPEGEYIFRIQDVKLDEKFGTLEMTFVTDPDVGEYELKKKFNIYSNDGSINDKIVNLLGWIYKACMDNEELEELDPLDFEGKYVQGTVEIQAYEKDGKTRLGLQITGYKPAPYHWGEEAQTADVAVTPTENADTNAQDLFNQLGI